MASRAINDKIDLWWMKELKELDVPVTIRQIYQLLYSNHAITSTKLKKLV